MMVQVVEHISGCWTHCNPHLTALITLTTVITVTTVKPKGASALPNPAARFQPPWPGHKPIRHHPNYAYRAILTTLTNSTISRLKYSAYQALETVMRNYSDLEAIVKVGWFGCDLWFEFIFTLYLDGALPRIIGGLKVQCQKKGNRPKKQFKSSKRYARAARPKFCVYSVLSWS